MTDEPELKKQIQAQLAFLEQELDDIDGHIFLYNQSIKLQEMRRQRTKERMHGLRNSLQIL